MSAPPLSSQPFVPPSNLPYVGRTRYRNLWLNTGHGTLGWTLGAGSGKRIVDMVLSEQKTPVLG